MSIAMWVFLLAVVGCVVWHLAFGGRLPKKFSERTCQGPEWRKDFPDVTKEEVRAYLLIFVRSFALREDQKLLLSPSDQLMGVYRAIYPNKWVPDGLEVETFQREMEKYYSVDLQAIWKDNITLGEVFTHTLTAR
jgi:propanediol dehydratase small subunit